jgi:hypothetical protein
LKRENGEGGEVSRSDAETRRSVIGDLQWRVSHKFVVNI